MPEPSVLILTHTADHFTVDRVAAAIARRHRRVHRFDTDRFPAHARIGALIGPAGSRFALHDDGLDVDAADIGAVWARRVWAPALGDDLDPRFRAACERESRTALRGFWDGLSEAHWINPPAVDRRAGDKLLQLRAARDVGLEVPRTLLTNDPAEARAFFDRLGGRVVAKMLTPLSVGMQAEGPFVYTSDVTLADLEHADTLRFSPMLFQERVPKECELRVVVAGGQLFAGALDAAATDEGRTDWRLSDPATARWQRANLPAVTARAVLALLESLALEFGALDLIRTPDGRHVFLEVNPGGEWGMLERDLDYDISGALAGALCGG